MSDTWPYSRSTFGSKGIDRSEGITHSWDLVEIGEVKTTWWLPRTNQVSDRGGPNLGS